MGDRANSNSSLNEQYFSFRAEKRNKHARVLTVRLAPSLKKWRDFRRSSKQKRLLVLNIPNYEQQHVNLTNGKLLYCFQGKYIFTDKINHVN